MNPQMELIHLNQPTAGAITSGTAIMELGSNGSGPPAPIPIIQPEVDLAKKTVCIKVRLSRMGNTRQVSTSQIEADADKDLLRVSKHLVDAAELKAIGRFDGEIRRYLCSICLPFEIGIHLLPIVALQSVEERLRQFALDREQLVKAFLAAYPSLCLDAAKRLRALLEWTPILRQPVKTQFSLNGKGSHERVSKILQQGVQGGRREAAGAGCIHRRSSTGV